jgi:hypothetical protein
MLLGFSRVIMALNDIAMGFRALEEFPVQWGEANPCL